MNAKLICLTCLTLLLFPVFGVAVDTPDPRLLRTSLVQGDVTYLRTDLDKWVDMSINTPILEGDKIWVGRDGRVEVEFEDLSYIRMGEDTVVEFARLGDISNSATAEVRVNRGVASFEISAEDGPMSVETPLFSALVRKPARFRVDVDSDGSARIVVFGGEAEIQSQTADLFLGSGENLQFLSNDPQRYYLGASYAEDDWDRWNNERSDYLARLSHERRYTDSNEWNTGELDTYGTWYNVPSYGQVWRPDCELDWVPFRSGRWVWYNSFGWTWVSYEPWGWLPYHYGRWSLVGSFGWCWVPGGHRNRWCPGAVSWIQGPSWVGWVPLAPSEPWYPYQNRSRPAANVFVSQNYRHRDVITYLPEDSFLNGTPSRDFKRPADPLRDGRVVEGQPSWAPTAMSRIPVVQTMATRKYNNDDLETRRNLREQIVNGNTAGLSSNPANGGPVEQRRMQREQIAGADSRVETIGRSNPSNSSVRVIQGGSNNEVSGRREDAQSNNEARSVRDTFRSEQRQTLDKQRVERTGTENQIRTGFENRQDRFQKEAGTSRSSDSGRSYNSYNSPTRVETPTSRSEPRQEARPMSPSSSSERMTSSAPVSTSRESTSQSRTESRSGGNSSQQGRSADHSRAGR